MCCRCRLLIRILLRVAGGTVEPLATLQAFTVDNIYVSTSNVRCLIFLLSGKKKKKEMEWIHAN